MKLFILLIALISTTPPEFKWKLEENVMDIPVKSVYDLSEEQKSKLFNIYLKSNFLYFDSHNHDTCFFSKLIIKIISPKMMNDRNKFDDIKDREIFGRYFWKYNMLYITEEAFTNPEYLAHELYHYFDEQCGIFNGVEEEEKGAYKFQELYLKKHGH